jgi:hypothetical protein
VSFLCQRHCSRWGRGTGCCWRPRRFCSRFFRHQWWCLFWGWVRNRTFYHTYRERDCNGTWV